MKIIVILLLSSVLLSACHSPGRYKTIKISDDLEVIRLSEKAYIHVSYYDYGNIGLYPANGLILFNDGKAFLFDTPPTDSLTKILVSWITGTLHSKIVGFVPNHWHVDCMGGLAYLQSLGIPSYANDMTIRMAKARSLPVPDYGFSNLYQFRFGSENIECYYPGPAHTTDNIVVWVPGEKILFAGCMCKDIKATGPGNTADANLREWPRTIRRVMIKYPDARIIIPGHGPPGGQELLEHTLALLFEKKFQAARSALSTGIIHQF